MHRLLQAYHAVILDILQSCHHKIFGSIQDIHRLARRTKTSAAAILFDLPEYHQRNLDENHRTIQVWFEAQGIFL